MPRGTATESGILIHHCRATIRAVSTGTIGDAINKKNLLGILLIALSPAANAIELVLPKVALQDIETAITVTDMIPDARVQLAVDGISFAAVADDQGQASFASIALASTGTADITASTSGDTASASLRV